MEAPEGEVADVFLSYARGTQRTARRIAASLRSCGFSVWFDEHLPAHRTFSEVIEEQLEAARAVVVLWSAEAVASQWVRSEANRARESGRLVQVRLDDARLPMPFDQVQCADLRKWSGAKGTDAWRTVEESVRALANGGDAPADGQPAGPSGVDRRTVAIAGGAAVVLALGGVAAWLELRGPELTPEQQLLLQKGLDALQQNDALDTELAPGAGAQAVALLTQATEATPHSAAAWGGLAMAYAVRSRASPPAERTGFEERSRSAAQRAFSLERNELRALAALRMLDRVYRNWLDAERAARRALELNPGFPIHIFLLSDVLGSVGRWREAAELSEKADRDRFLIPGADRKVIVNRWAAGKLQEADEALEQAVERWPEHPQVWRTRVAYLMYSGRPAEALQLLDSSERPPAIPAGLVNAAGATARALAGVADPPSAVRENLSYVSQVPDAALPAAAACAAVGDADTALALLRGYYFGEAPWATLAPEGGDSTRVTSQLFLPPMRNLWRDERFDSLLERIGLVDYWRKRGIPPDFRSG